MKPLSDKAQYLRARLEVGGTNPIMVTRLELETELLRADRSRRSVGPKEISRLICELRSHGADIEELKSAGFSRRIDGYLLKGWK